MGIDAESWRASARVCFFFLPQHSPRHGTQAHQLILSEEVSFRFAGNKLLDPGTSTMTLGAFYDHYSHPSRAEIYLQGASIPSTWKSLYGKGKGPAICLEAYIAHSKVCSLDATLTTRHTVDDHGISFSNVQVVKLKILTLKITTKMPALKIPRRNLSPASVVAKNHHLQRVVLWFPSAIESLAVSLVSTICFAVLQDADHG